MILAILTRFLAWHARLMLFVCVYFLSLCKVGQPLCQHNNNHGCRHGHGAWPMPLSQDCVGYPRTRDDMTLPEAFEQ